MTECAAEVSPRKNGAFDAQHWSRFPQHRAATVCSLYRCRTSANGTPTSCLCRRADTNFHVLRDRFARGRQEIVSVGPSCLCGRTENQGRDNPTQVAARDAELVNVRELITAQHAEHVLEGRFEPSFRVEMQDRLAQLGGSSIWAAGFVQDLARIDGVVEAVVKETRPLYPLEVFYHFVGVPDSIVLELRRDPDLEMLCVGPATTSTQMAEVDVEVDRPRWSYVSRAKCPSPFIT